LGINLYHDAGTPAFMSDHGRMQTPGQDVAEPHLHRRVTSFRTRRSTLSGGQQATWERLWPEMGMLARDADGPAPPLDTEAWFGRSAPVVLEIGSGLQARAGPAAVRNRP
jgi:tRNA (guanine-N7-)-methyltransferase